MYTKGGSGHDFRMQVEIFYLHFLSSLWSKQENFSENILNFWEHPLFVIMMGVKANQNQTANHGQQGLLLGALILLTCSHISLRGNSGALCYEFQIIGGQTLEAQNTLSCFDTNHNLIKRLVVTSMTERLTVTAASKQKDLKNVVAQEIRSKRMEGRQVVRSSFMMRLLNTISILTPSDSKSGFMQSIVQL